MDSPSAQFPPQFVSQWFLLSQCLRQCCNARAKRETSKRNVMMQRRDPTTMRICRRKVKCDVEVYYTSTSAVHGRCVACPRRVRGGSRLVRGVGRTIVTGFVVCRTNAPGVFVLAGRKRTRQGSSSRDSRKRGRILTGSTGRSTYVSHATKYKILQ